MTPIDLTIDQLLGRRPMRDWPTDPIRQHNRLIAAMCDDWLDTGKLALDGPKTSRVAEINRQVSKEAQRERGN